MNMMTTIPTAAEATMSSLEIAELTGKRHDNVMADCRIMFEVLEIGALSFQGTYRTAQGKTAPCFHLSRDLTITLVTGYSIPMRHAVVTRWAELEAKVAKPALPDFSDEVAAARAWADEREAKRVAQAKVAELEPVAAVGALTADSSDH